MVNQQNYFYMYICIYIFRYHDSHCYKHNRTSKLDNLLKCEDIKKYFIGLLMFRIDNNEMPIFSTFFTRNRDVHSHDTRQKDYFHIAPFKPKLRKASLRHNGASIWNMILRIGINTKSSEFQCIKVLKAR